MRPKNSPRDAAIVGEQPSREFETTSWPEVSIHSKLSTIDDLRSAGIGVGDGRTNFILEKIISGEPFEAADYAAAQAFKQSLFNDPELPTGCWPKIPMCIGCSSA